MRLGKEKHEKVLTDTIQQLEMEGFKLIRLDGKSPTAIAVKDNTTIAVCLVGRRKNKHGSWAKSRTIIFLEDWYSMFDRIDRILFDRKTKNQKTVLNETIKQYQDNGYNVIALEKKSPDAIAVKNNRIFAIEIIGLPVGSAGKYHIKAKEDIYDMFDGLMIKTFYYDNDASNDVFTETFGKNNIIGGGKE